MAGSLSTNLPWPLANTKWASVLNPVLANPLLGGQVIGNVTLRSGDNTINHGLSRKLQGYVVILKSADVAVYDKQLANQRPELTLVLNSSGSAIVSLYVF